MSTDWDVYCRTCNEEYGFGDANRRDAEMRALAKHAAAIAAIGRILDEVGQESPVLAGALRLHTSCIVYGDPPLNTSWFAKHAGHDLVARNEYGRCDDECGEWFDCAGCRHRAACSLPKGHAGEHKVGGR